MAHMSLNRKNTSRGFVPMINSDDIACWKCHIELLRLSVLAALFQHPAVLFHPNSKATPEAALMCNLLRHIPLLCHLCEHQL